MFQALFPMHGRLSHNFFWHDQDLQVEFVNGFDGEPLQPSSFSSPPSTPWLGFGRLGCRFDLDFQKLFHAVVGIIYTC